MMVYVERSSNVLLKSLAPCHECRSIKRVSENVINEGMHYQIRKLEWVFYFFLGSDVKF